MVRQTSIIGVLGIVGLASGGCGAQDPTPGPLPSPSPSMPVSSVASPAPVTTRAYLAEPRIFHIEAAGSVSVTASRALDGKTETALLPMSSGSVTVQAREDGALAVTSLDLELGSFTVTPASFPPDGLDLERLVLSLGAETDASADWSGDASAMNGVAEAELLLDWSVDEAGTTLPLATEHIAKVTVELAVSRAEDGTVVLDLHASRDGIFWTWADLLDLSDLHVDLRAAP